jgi:hypothetical protein
MSDTEEQLLPMNLNAMNERTSASKSESLPMIESSPTVASDDRKNREKLREVIQQVWRDMKSEMINAIVAEILRRLNSVIGREERTLQHF